MTKQEEQPEIFKKVYFPEKPKKDGEYTCGNDYFFFKVNFMKGVWMCQNSIAIAWFYEPIEPQPPVEGDVRDAKELIYQMFDDMFKSFDKSIAQKIKQVTEDGDGEVPHSAYWKSCGLYDSKAIVKRLFANSVNNDICKPLFALLSKYNFTRKG